MTESRGLGVCWLWALENIMFTSRQSAVGAGGLKCVAVELSASGREGWGGTVHYSIPKITKFLGKSNFFFFRF